MNQTVKLSLFMFCGSVLLLGQESAPVDSSLKQIETLYNSAQYVTAELEARRLYEEKELTDSARVQIEKWIAFSLIAQGKSSTARERFVTLLSINPDFELDPVLTSPKILSVFYEARTKFLSQRKIQTDSVLQTTEVSQSATYRTIVFPGWEQLYQGRTASGVIFLSAGVASLGAGVAFELLRSDARQQYLKASSPSDISRKYNSYNTYRKAEMYSFIAYAIIYVASEVDILSNSNSAGISFRSSQSTLGETALTLSIGF